MVHRIFCAKIKVIEARESIENGDSPTALSDEHVLQSHYHINHNMLVTTLVAIARS